MKRLFLLSLLATPVFAQNLPKAQRLPPPDPNALVFSADRYAADLTKQTTTVSGHVEVRLGDQQIYADEAVLNASTGEVSAKGNVFFKQGQIEIHGGRTELNMNSGLGSFYDAVFQIKDGPHVEARVMKRYAEDRYQLQNGKITTCQDCPQAWSVTGVYIDVQVEGYAEIHHALFQIKDTPVAYFPIFYFPVKTKRQSGFLIPQFEHSPILGSQLAIPYFWALSSYADTTFEYRYMAKGGHRIGNELRYQRSDRTFASGLSSFTANQTCDPARPAKDCRPNVDDLRFGLSFSQRWQISDHWTQRFRGELASDPRYTRDFSRDFNGAQLPSLVNEPSVSWQSPNYFGSGLVQLYRDNIPRDVDPATVNKIYPRAPGIHSLPRLEVARPSTPLFKALRWSLDAQHLSLRRFARDNSVHILSTSPLDSGLDPRSGWVRTGDRTTLIGRLNAPLNVLKILDWNPSVEFRLDGYHFSAPGVGSTAARGRLFVDQRFSTDIWKIYKTDLGDLKAIRHTLTPTIRWSYSPNDALSHDPNDPTKPHPFFTQANAPRFDLFDPASDAGRVQLGTINEEQRLLPHHRLAVGLETRFVGRYGETNRRYEELLMAGVAQDIDLWHRELSRLEIYGNGNFRGFHFNAEMRLAVQDVFGPDETGARVKLVSKGDANIRTEANYTFSRYTLGALYKEQPDEKKIGLTAGFRELGPWSFLAAIVYDPLAGPTGLGRVHERDFILSYASPSKCWAFSFELTQPAGQSKFTYIPKIGLSFTEGTKGSFL